MSTVGTMVSCECAECVANCKRYPGWFTPDEAKRAIDAGYANRLMRDYWEGEKTPIYVLAPAVVGCEGGDIQPDDAWIGAQRGLMAWVLGEVYPGRCTFLADDKCAIHDSGFKPIQCRTAFCQDTENKLWKSKLDVADLWNTEEGHAVLALWEERRHG